MVSIQDDGNGRQLALVIRTGCLRCRARGVKCDPTNPECKRFNTDDWNYNIQYRSKGFKTRRRRFADGAFSIARSPDVGWEGTHREQQSLYFFANISAPELGGYMDFSFWEEVLLQAAHHDAALRHATAAIGAAHEYKLRTQAAKFNMETDGLETFALRQINKSIKSLIQPSQGTYYGLLRALTSSLLFASYESVRHGRGAALDHVMHAIRILKQLKETAASDAQMNPLFSAYPISLEMIEPLVVQFESQTGVYYGDEDGGKEEYPDPQKPLVIRSVTDARILLLQGASMTQDAITRYADNETYAGFLQLQTAKLQLANFARNWNTAFERYLARTQIDSSTIRTCKLMKSHQMALLIVSSSDSSLGTSCWKPFTDDMRLIVNMLSDLHATDPRRTTPSSQAPHTPYFSTTMGMTEPLYIVASRCADAEVRAKARSTLAKLPPSEGANSSWRISFLERFLHTITVWQEPPADWKEPSEIA